MGKRHRGTARHAGVVLLRRSLPSGGTSWRARYRDPDSGRTLFETLPNVLTTEEQRTAWAIEKSRAIRERARVLAMGAPNKKHVSLSDAVQTYFDDVSAGLRQGTLEIYREASKAMLAWAAHRNITLADNLRGEELAALRTYIAKQPLRRREKGKPRRGSLPPTKRVRSPARINSLLRPIKTMLEHLRRRGLVPLLTHDAITDHLKLFPEPRPVPAFLRPAQLAALVAAGRKHDADTFAMTREEKERGKGKGSTLRHEPILPYIAVVLLTGMRADEARCLRWSAVDLAAAPAGNILLRPEDVKTKHGRIVDLIVSEALHELLASMRLRASEETFVFGDARDERGHTVLALTRGIVEACRRRLVGAYGAPRFSWQQLRVTCGTFLANAPGIFGAASAYREARQLGHSVTVAEKHYLGVVHVDPEARTLEAAMGIDAPLRTAFGLETAPRKVAPNRR